MKGGHRLRLEHLVVLDEVLLPRVVPMHAHREGGWRWREITSLSLMRYSRRAFASRTRRLDSDCAITTADSFSPA